MARGRKVSTVKSGVKSPVKVKLTRKESKDLKKKQKVDAKLKEENFTENLIADINARSFIFDRSDPNHDRKKLINKAWVEISDEVGLDLNSCHTRWRSLRIHSTKNSNLPEKTVDTSDLSTNSGNVPSVNSDDVSVEDIMDTDPVKHQVPSVSDSLKRSKRKKSPEEDLVLDKLVKLIDMQFEPGKQTKSAAFFQYLELEMNAFSGDEEEDFIDAYVDKLREIKNAGSNGNKLLNSLIALSMLTLSIGNEYFMCQ
ncbi:unnamed protein product [Allacma fusca]|uniref:MADF domain-containing protein n=1 Tax=Allacma fusca TaxID=39272 RepID=A0A8J2LAQ4_9HEXA|nr:unnamed protein product [Allacma fusca]